MAEQQSQVFLKLIEMQMRVIADIKKSKQKLIVVVLERIDYESRLNNLRQTLLESQIQNETEIAVEDNFISSMFAGMKELSAEQLEDITEMMKKIFDPVLKYRKLLDSIGEVMRQKDLTNKTKLDQISDLLI